MRGKKKIDEERCQKIDSAGRHEGHTFRSIKKTHKRSGFVCRVLRAALQVDSQSDLYHQPTDLLFLVVNHISKTFLRTCFPIYRYAYS